MAAYDCEAVGSVLKQHVARAKTGLARAGFDLVASFQVVGGKALDITGNREVTETDAAYLWVRPDDGQGILAFRGSDTEEDLKHIRTAISADVCGYQVHREVAESEFLPLVAQMSAADFAGCESLAVAGHSLGGGCASLFAVLSNDTSDPLGLGSARKLVDELYAFGSIPVFSGPGVAANARPGSGGTFAGGVFRTVREVRGKEVQDAAVRSLEEFHHARTNLVSLRFSSSAPEEISSTTMTSGSHKDIPADATLFPLHSPINYIKLLGASSAGQRV
jgi:hypothetical protein